MLRRCKHAQNTNLNFKNLKYIKKPKKIWVGSSLNWGVFTPRCKNITDYIAGQSTSSNFFSSGHSMPYLGSVSPCMLLVCDSRRTPDISCMGATRSWGGGCCWGGCCPAGVSSRRLDNDTCWLCPSPSSLPMTPARYSSCCLSGK